LSNIFYLDDYRKFVPDDEPDIFDPIVIGWEGDSDDKSLYIASSVDIDECLWMIDLAKKILESRSPDIINENE